MSTAKGFTLRVIGSQSVSEPFSRERGVGQGCPLAPLLFALAIEPLSRMLKQTMTGMQIDRIHVKQDTTHTVVAMCADDTTIFAGGLDDTIHAKDAIQCYTDAPVPFASHSFVLTAHISCSECVVFGLKARVNSHTPASAMALSKQPCCTSDQALLLHEQSTKTCTW